MEGKAVMLVFLGGVVFGMCATVAAGIAYTYVVFDEHMGGISPHKPPTA